MMNTDALGRLLTQDYTVTQFAELMHDVMTEYVRMACHAGAEAYPKKLAQHIDFLESVRKAALECGPSLKE